MSDTPETDEAQFGTGRVSVDFARRLERERDDARREVATQNEYFDKIHEILGESRDSDKSEIWRFFERAKSLDFRILAAESERDALREENWELATILKMTLDEWRAGYSTYGSATFSQGNQAVERNQKP